MQDNARAREAQRLNLFSQKMELLPQVQSKNAMMSTPHLVKLSTEMPGLSGDCPADVPGPSEDIDFDPEAATRIYAPGMG